MLSLLIARISPSREGFLGPTQETVIVPRKFLETVYRQALRAVDPYQAVLSQWQEPPPGPVWLLAVGKAAPAMARACRKALGDRLSGGFVLTKDEHLVGPQPPPLQYFEASHPVPDARGLEVTHQILAAISQLPSAVHRLVALSGGASALLVAPVEKVGLEGLKRVNQRLLASGATIDQVNTVRKHLSRVKGGRLALALGGCHTVVLSDVLGSPLEVIGSGPTAPDPTTIEQARQLAAQLGLGDFPWEETPGPEHPVFERVTHQIVADNQLLAQAAIEALKPRPVTLWSTRLEGEASQRGVELARLALTSGPGYIVASGETTVTLTGSGRGGRCQELALAFALAVEGHHHITLLAGSSDGGDGPTPAAGAVVDGGTCERARVLGLKPEVSLANHDSFTFFDSLGEALVTGPTGTNVNDLLVVEIAGSPDPSLEA